MIISPARRGSYEEFYAVRPEAADSQFMGF